MKNQWGWGGFTTKDLLRCQVAARNVALIYNWWTLFVRLAEPGRPREAITSRPLLLCAVGRLVEHAGQTVPRLTSSHAEGAPSPDALDAPEPVLERLAERCGAVDQGGVLAADLGSSPSV